MPCVTKLTAVQRDALIKRKVFDLDEDGELITADDTSDEDSQTTQSIDSQELTPMILTDPKPVKQSQK